MPAAEIRWHWPHRINAVVAATPGTCARSERTTSISPRPPAHAQGQTLRSFAIDCLLLSQGLARARRRYVCEEMPTAPAIGEAVPGIR